jgi:hypothetical protein
MKVLNGIVKMQKSVGLIENIKHLFVKFAKKNINQSMSYEFKNELEEIGDIRAALKFDGSMYPDIIQTILSGAVSWQTFVILNYFIQFIPKFDARLPDDFIWSKLSFKAKKFAPFIIPQIDKKKFADLLKSHVEDTIYS